MDWRRYVQLLRNFAPAALADSSVELANSREVVINIPRYKGPPPSRATFEAELAAILSTEAVCMGAHACEAFLANDDYAPPYPDRRLRAVHRHGSGRAHPPQSSAVSRLQSRQF